MVREWKEVEAGRPFKPERDFPGGPVAMTPYFQCRGLPGQGTRSHMPQIRVCLPQRKILHAAKEIEDPVCCN